MKLITSSKRDAGIVPHTPDDPRCVALKQRYGDAVQMSLTWSPQRRSVIAANASRSENAPSLVLMMRAYGVEHMHALMAAHVTAAIVNAGLADKFAGDDYQRIAAGILNNEDARTLNMAYLLRFFQQFSDGVFEMYGYTPHSVLRVFNTYIKDALFEQRKMMQDAERDRAAEEYRRHAAESVTWSQFCQQKGIDENEIKNPLAQREK